jgi:hypothetical protein
LITIYMERKQKASGVPSRKSKTSDDEDKDLVVVSTAPSPSLLKDLLRQPRSKKGFHYQTVLWFGGQIIVNSSAAKYLQFLNGVTQLTWGSILGSLPELTSLDSLFDEFFCRKMRLHFHPRNMHSANSTASATAAGSPGDLNTCGATIVGLPHAASPYTDSNMSWINMSASERKKFVNLGASWSFSFPNPEKFSWDGPVGDQTTSFMTMSWCSFTAIAKHGGFFQIATPAASGASAGIGSLLEGGIFGDYIIECHVACRARA